MRSNSLVIKTYAVISIVNIITFIETTFYYPMVYTRVGSIENSLIVSFATPK